MNFDISISRWNGFSIMKIAQDLITPSVDDGILYFVRNSHLYGKNVIDGGSNIGIMSLLFSEAVGDSGIVYAFELQRIIQQVGCANAVLNGRMNIVFFNAALSDKSGEMVGFSNIDYTSEVISSTGIRTEPTFGKTDYYDRAKTIALDDLNIPNVGLIKLDIEGHEPEALNGMWQTIDRCRPNMIIELSDGYLGSRVKETIDKIISHGYTVTESSNHNYFAIPN